MSNKVEIMTAQREVYRRQLEDATKKADALITQYDGVFPVHVVQQLADLNGKIETCLVMLQLIAQHLNPAVETTPTFRVEKEDVSYQFSIVHIPEVDDKERPKTVVGIQHMGRTHFWVDVEGRQTLRWTPNNDVLEYHDIEYLPSGVFVYAPTDASDTEEEND